MSHPLKRRLSLCNNCINCIYAVRLGVVTCGAQMPKYGKTGVARAIPAVQRCKFYVYGEHPSWVTQS